ncbi:NAD-dependent epimerase/dehydratase family protein [Planktomarina temperata]|nr:NAD-dependent epimerase/dehydratase family protein [Planktomarina temperata]
MTYSLNKQLIINKYLNDHLDVSSVKSSLTDFYTGKHLIITGFSGGLGQSLATVLMSLAIENCEISLVGRQDNIECAWSALKENNSVSFVSMTELAKLECANPIVFHFAGYAQPAKFLKEDTALIELNTTLIIKLLALKPQRFVYSSTTEVYSGNITRCTENAPVLMPTDHVRGIYVYSKLLGESLLFKQAPDIAYCYRIALATPPWYDPTDDRVLADLITKAINENSVSLLGGHSSVRSYQYGPLCVLKMLIATKDEHSAGLYNLSGGEQLTLGEIAQEIARLMNVEYLTMATNINLGAPQVVDVDSSRILKLLPKHTKNESLHSVLCAYKND